MSYILEALKKAEAERQQGAVPSLHAPAATLPAAIDLPARRRQIIVGAGILLAISLGAVAWLRPWQSGPTPLPAPMPLAAEPSPMPARASLPEAAVVAVAPAAPTEVVQQPKTKPKAAAQERPPKAFRQAEAASASAAAVIPTASVTPPAPAAPIASRDLPGVSIGGYIYSEIPAERQLLVNKRLMHEGEEVTPGLTLEKMLPKAAIFNYRGQRYQVAY